MTTAAAIVGRFAPGLAALLSYQRRDLVPDLVAGLSVAAIALPVGIAYAEIARVSAVVGICSAIVPLFAYALFGSSRQLMTGPDAATCIMAAAAVGSLAGDDPARYPTLMVALTLMTGVLYLFAGIARLGFIANFLSRPILVGYLNGIALIILVGQVPKLCGFTAATGGSFVDQIAGVAAGLEASHPPTLILGACLLVLLVVLQRLVPRLPGAIIVAGVAIAVVAGLGLADRGVAVLGAVPAGLPRPDLPSVTFGEFKTLGRDAVGLLLISFTSGVLTAMSFAQRNRYDVDANQELIGYGACNLAAALAQGFPVTGAGSRTAVNDAAGGRTQAVGIVAGGAMLLFLLFLTTPLAYLPMTALAAIIIASVAGMFDLSALRRLWGASRRELAFSLATTAGVLFFGVLAGVLLAVLLSVLWLLSVASRPHDAVLGRAPGVKGFHDITDYPGAQTIPGLLIYRFDADLLFFNCSHFKERVLTHVGTADTPVEWVLVDASSINVVDYTAVRKMDELREDLRRRGIALAYARAKQSLNRFFRSDWLEERGEGDGRLAFTTIKQAIEAFENRNRPASIFADPEIARVKPSVVSASRERP